MKILCAASNEFAQNNTERRLETMLKDTRIEPECDAFMKPENARVSELIRSRSQTVDIVFLGLAVPEAGGDYQGLSHNLMPTGKPRRKLVYGNDSNF